MLDFLKQGLKQSEDLSRAVRFARKRVMRGRREAYFKEYIANTNSPRLQIGSGANHLDGWLNTENFDTKFYLDATESFPFSADTFDYILCEHTIEHIQFNQAVAMLKECFRVLRPRGRVRITTPNLEVYVRMLTDDGALGKDAMERTFNEWILPGFYAARNYTPLSPEPNAAFVINDIFRNYEHKFIYDFKTLASVVCNAGFRDIQRVTAGQSDAPELRGKESHVKPYEVHVTLGIEAVKPSC